MIRLTPKQERANRAALIAQLGWPKEPGTSADERYCATTGELAQTVREKFGDQIVDNCRSYALSV